MFLGVNPDLDVMSLATTNFVATNNGFLTPAASLTEAFAPWRLVGFAGFIAAVSSPGFCRQASNLPPVALSTLGIRAANHQPHLTQPEVWLREQWNLDIQRQLLLASSPTSPTLARMACTCHSQSN